MTAAALFEQFLSHIFNGALGDALALVDPQAVFISTNPVANPRNPLHGTFIGKDGAKAFFGGFSSLLEPGDFQVTAAFEDEEHAAFYGTLRHTARATGKEFASDWALIGRVKDGKIVLYHFYEDSEALLKAITG